MTNKQIQLTEQDLHILVEDAVRTYLRENGMEEGVWSGMKNAMRGIGNGNFHMMQNYRSGSYAGSIQKYGQNAINALNQFKGILNKSGAQQIVPQIENISSELTKIMNNYQNIAQQSSNKNAVNAAAQQDDTQQGGNTSNGFALGQMERASYNNALASTQQPQQTQSVGAPAAMNTGRQNINNQYADMNKMKFRESKNIKITQSDLRKLVSETVNILLAEDGEKVRNLE